MEAYALPRPDTASEISRLDQQHQVWRLTIGSYIRSKLPQTQSSRKLRILDVGCGTGSWSLAVALCLPNADVIAVDLNPPSENSFSVPKPDNLTILKADVEKDDWSTFVRKTGNANGTHGEDVDPRPDSLFDMIHARMLVLGVRDWPALFQNCFQNLRPGGAVEVSDSRLGISAADGRELESAPERWTRLFKEALPLQGRVWGANQWRAADLQSAGFVDVQEHWFRWPTGEVNLALDGKGVGVLDVAPDSVGALEGVTIAEREKEISLLTLGNARRFVLATSEPILSTVPGWTQDSAKELGDQAITELETLGPQRGFYLTMSLHIGRRPDPVGNGA